MAAQSISRSRKKTITRRTKKPTPKQAKILEVKTDHPDLTTRQIATLADTDHSHVVKTLQAYGITQYDADAYTKHRAVVFSGLQHRILKSVTEDDIKAASVLQRVTAAGILYDKERLERNLSTTNVAYDPGAMRERYAELRALMAQSAQIVDITPEKHE